MSCRPIVGASGLLMTAVAGIVAAQPAVGASPAPQVELSTRVLAPGATVTLTGEHWEAGTTLHAVLCGADAVDGSVDCVEQAAVTMTPGPDGTLQGSLPVVAPPKPCPCVVLITDLSSAYVSRVPVDVVGVPSEAVASVAPATRPLTVKVEASVSGGTSLASVLGGAAHRFVNVTVTNTGPVAIMPVVIARWGRGSAPHRVIGSPSPVALAPGETRTVHMPLRLDPLSFGGYRVTGSVAGGARTVPFSTSASTWPWGLLLVGQAVLVAARNAVRRHLERQEAKERRAARRAGRRGARVAT